MSWICLVLQIPHGLGRHGWVVPVEERIKFEQITFWKTVFSDGVAMGLLRISMAISLLRLKKDLKWYRYSLFAVMGKCVLWRCSSYSFLVQSTYRLFVAGFVVAYSIQAIAWLFVYCTPFSGWWEFQWMNPFDPRCKSFTTFVNLVYWNICEFLLGWPAIPLPLSLTHAMFLTIYNAACNIFTDVLLGALPVPIIWGLKMRLRVKLYVIGILNLGYL
jgi:hypothetical protein